MIANMSWPQNQQLIAEQKIMTQVPTPFFLHIIVKKAVSSQGKWLQSSAKKLVIANIIASHRCNTMKLNKCGLNEETLWKVSGVSRELNSCLYDNYMALISVPKFGKIP